MLAKPAVVADRRDTGGQDLFQLLKFERMTGSMGAEVFGVGPSNIDDKTIAAIKAALAVLPTKNNDRTFQQYVALRGNRALRSFARRRAGVIP